MLRYVRLRIGLVELLDHSFEFNFIAHLKRKQMGNFVKFGKSQP